MGLRSKSIAAGTYKRRKLTDLVEGRIELIQFDKSPQIKRMNKLEGISEVVFTLDELDNTNNLEDGKPSNALFTYHVTEYDDYTQFKPYALQYKKLKNGKLVSLALKVMHKKNNIITDGSATTVVFNIQ